jgi:hypothetical protein
MTKKEFQQELKSSVNIAVQRANKFLEQLGLSLHINSEYNDWSGIFSDAIGIYENDSVFEGDISIGFNVNNLYKSVKWQIKHYPFTDKYTMLDETIQTNVFHEMGHGIIQYLDDIIEYWDEDEELPFYDKNQEFCDNVLDNEEDSVEEFAWAFYDNEVGNSQLGKLVQLYLNWCNSQQNSINEDKLGGVNFSNRGDSFYTQEKDIVNELSNYDLNGKIVYCNCDRPSVSNFYKFFKQNFVQLGLRGLYATYYDNNPKVYYFDGATEKSSTIQSGRFQDNAFILKKCDIIITNPPFSNSMASELIRMAQQYGKHLIIVGPNTIANQKDMFDMIKNNQLNMGYTSINRFSTPNGEIKTAPTSWWTNMNVNKPMFKTGIRYNPKNYQKYDNFDAIDIKDYRQMPDDYYGYMGVSPKFLRVLNRRQFDIVAKIRPVINGKTGFEKYIIKRKNPQQQFAESLTNRVFKNLRLLLC